MNSRALLVSVALALAAAQPRVLAQSKAFLFPAQRVTSAIDAEGARHTEPARPGRLPPWFEDRVKAVAPYYPYLDRKQRHTGAGLFRLQLDLKTGAVSRVIVVKSTGFQTLDNCVMVALRQWRWKPGRWRQVEMGVTFKLAAPPSEVAPGTVRLPNP